jgi:NAD(P)-dependent dehydrogenase (short-subunit alcohol dehydrogenase family)
VLELDLNTLPSVASAASAFKSQSDRLDILINNAGIMGQDGKTAEGYEKQLGVNHLGHALFTKLLLPTMLKTASEKNSDVRIVNLSSGAHTRAPAPGFDPNDAFMPKSGPMGRYGRAKLANVLFAKEMAKRYPQIKTVALHPGVIRTNLFNPIMESNKLMGLLSSTFGFLVYTTVEEGAKNSLWAATAPKANVESGAYYVPVGKKDEASAYARDEKLADSLWNWTEAELQKQGY